MKDNGFTLIELLAVIVILAIILVIAVPQILGVIRNSKIGAMESDAKLVLNAIQQKKALDPSFDPTQYNGNLSGLLSELGISGNNYTSVSFSYNEGVLFITVEGKEKYDGLVACGTYHNMIVEEGECGYETDITAPIITLNGEENIELEQGVTYTEGGATATDDVDVNVTVTISGTVDTATLGTYTITYTAEDASGNVSTKTRTINVVIPDTTPPVITLNGNSSVVLEQGTSYTELGATAVDNKDGAVTVTITGTVDTSTLGTYTKTYTATDNKGNISTSTRTINVILANYAGPGYIISKGVNGPVLAQGMTPIKWSGSAWVSTTVNDSGWYNYTSADRKWANAKTADGSMWVWIPRYAYQIETNYHTATAGTINIKFLQGTTKTAADSSSVDSLPSNSGNSQTNYALHPAFDFGGTQITGIWISKFEMSGTTTALDSKPGIASLRNLTIGTIFTSLRNMETNNRYGWGLASGLNANGVFSTDTNNVDTHLIKNLEWGSVAYLSKSQYGKNARITANASSSYYTGGGTSTAYVTNIDQSTTGNVSGIYDMAGGAYEYVMANYNNLSGSSGITPSNIHNKYIDRYTAYSNVVFGDAIFESSSSLGVSTSWFGEYAYMADLDYPWLIRSGYYNEVSSAGIFNYNHATGAGFGHFSFHSVILAGQGL